LFVKKKTGELRLVVDYRGLEEFKGAKYFSKLDLISGYFQIRINHEDDQETAFNTLKE